MPRSSRGRRERCFWVPRGVLSEASALRNGSGEALTCITSFGVGLVLRLRLFKGGEFRACRIDRDDFGKSIERHLQTPRVVDLRHQADVDERDLVAEGIGRRVDHGFYRGEALENAVVIPGVDFV